MQVTWSHSKPTQLTWIGENPENRAGKANQSTLRAHAARVAHQRRRMKQVAEHSAKSQSPASTASTASTPSTDDLLVGRRRQVLPKPTPWHGKSDPFDSLCLSITPDEAQTIDFIRDIWIPWTHDNLPAEYLMKQSEQAFQRRALEGYVATLRNNTFGKAFLLPFMVMLQQLVQRQDLEMRIASLRLEVLQTLKKNLKTQTTTETSTMYLLQSLLLASIAERRLWEIEVHTKAMQIALTARYDSRGGLSSVCGDCPSLAEAKSLNYQAPDRSLLEDVVPRFLSMFTSPYSVLQSTPLNAFCGWEMDPLRKFGLDIRHCLWMWHMARVTSPSLLFNRQFASMIWMGIYDYLKEIETLLNLDVFLAHTTAESRAHWHSQACMAIGLLCHLRTHAIVEIPQPEILAWLIRRLQIYFPQAVASTEEAGASCKVKHADTLLFSLRCAAVLERCTPGIDGVLSQLSPASRNWSQQKFIATAKQRGFLTWEGVHAVLAKLAPYVAFPVAGQDWITAALAQSAYSD